MTQKESKILDQLPVPVDEISPSRMTRDTRKMLLDVDLPGRLTFTHLRVQGAGPYLGSCSYRGRITLAYTSLYYWKIDTELSKQEYLEVQTFWGASYCGPWGQFNKGKGRDQSLKSLASLLHGTWANPFNGGCVCIPGPDRTGDLRLVRRDVKQGLVEHFRSILEGTRDHTYGNRNEYLSWVTAVLPEPIPGWLKNIDVFDID
jgi:hypothetical protein